MQELRRSCMQDHCQISVVSEVTRQKDNRGDERRNHAVAMRNFVFPADENKTNGQEDRAETIERGIDGGQIVDIHQPPSNCFTVARICGLTFAQSTSWPSV